MATRCFGRAFFAGAGALPLLFSLRRAVVLVVVLAAALRGDFFCAADFAAARAAGFFAFFLAIDALPSVRRASVSRMAFVRVGKAKRAHHREQDRRRMVGTALSRLCPPYKSKSRRINAAGTRRRRRGARQA